MASSDDSVGYSKPPKKHQFKKGRSGNPAGRPKGPTTFPWLVLQALDRAVNVRKGDASKKMRAQKALAEMFVREGLGGDAKARAELLRIEDQYRDGYESHKADLALNAKEANARHKEVYSYYPPELLQVVILHYKLEAFIKKNLSTLRRLRAQEDEESGNET